MAQRMESAASPGGVMLSESTARLVEDQVTLGDQKLVRIKNAEEPISARPLRAVDGEGHRAARSECRLVGRAFERDALGDAISRALNGGGGAVAVAGPPGIGKSRLVRESSDFAKSLGAEVLQIYCESDTREVASHVIARAVRSAENVGGLSADEARTQIRGRLADRDERDLLLLYDLLGIRDVSVAVPDLSPDARRRRIVEILTDGAATQLRAHRLCRRGRTLDRHGERGSACRVGCGASRHAVVDDRDLSA